MDQQTAMTDSYYVFSIIFSVSQRLWGALHEEGITNSKDYFLRFGKFSPKLSYTCHNQFWTFSHSHKKTKTIFVCFCALTSTWHTISPTTQIILKRLPFTSWVLNFQCYSHNNFYEHPSMGSVGWLISIIPRKKMCAFMYVKKRTGSNPRDLWPG